jgi:HTH-type transcriptional regulator, transcriptional repressor of NAD biosynthesis genes
MFRHGLIVGKFYPPHAGHHHLIDTAAGQCERLTVVVAPSRRESIPLAARCDWLRARHPGVRIVGVYDDHPVDYDDPHAWDVHCAVFRDALAGDTDGGAAVGDGALGGAAVGERTAGDGAVADVAVDDRSVGGAAVDAVFSSEAYGDELARRFNARHVCVDIDRRTLPMSGTAVRRDPIAHWDALGPGARGWFARRVIVVGAESTGTTTMARALAERFRARGGVWSRTRWIPEYGRELTERKLTALRDARPDASVFDVAWDRDDFVDVATEQNRAEDAAAEQGSPVVFGDTDAFATAIWEERYLGSASPDVVALARRPDLYLLTDHAGVPFEDDGLRDGEDIRTWMSLRFRERLTAQDAAVVMLTGPHERRLDTAIQAVDVMLATGWTLADPL